MYYTYILVARPCMVLLAQVFILPINISCHFPLSISRVLHKGYHWISGDGHNTRADVPVCSHTGAQQLLIGLRLQTRTAIII